MSYDTSITLCGNLCFEPEIKFLNDGKATLSLNIAVNKVVGEEKRTSYFDVTLWGKPAEHAAKTLKKGDRVIVFGEPKQRSYADKDGKQRSAVEIVASDIGPSLMWSTAEINRSK
jgi:single-strand DNA-binding protein